MHSHHADVTHTDVHIPVDRLETYIAERSPTLSAHRTSFVVPWEINSGTDMLIEAWTKAAGTLSADGPVSNDDTTTRAKVRHTILGEHRGGLSDGNHLWRLWPTIDGLGVAGGDAHRSGAEYVEWGAFEEKVVLNCLAILHLAEQARACK